MIYSIFKDKVHRFPDAIGFVFENGKKHITYAQADKIIDSLACYLHQKGVKEGDRIGLLTKNESTHPFFFYALNKLNATYVPFDSNSPKQSLEFDVARLKLDHFFHDDNFNIDDISTSETQLSDIIYNPEIPVYIVSSSGTAGNKKWIPIHGEGLKYWEKTEEEMLGLKPGHKVLCTRSPAYDARISEYLRALTAGGELHLISMNERKDLDFIVQYCEANQITELLMIASQLKGENLELMITRLSKAKLKNLIVTGDACSPLLQTLCKKYSINLINAYGPTEATFGISLLIVNDIDLLDEHGNPVVPIGLPAGSEIKVHIIDGKLYIESPYLMKAYLNDPENTEKVFKIIQVDGQPVRVFDTGDRFELKDGKLLFKGRHEASNDSKVVGVKVDSHATEQLIQQYPGISQACVVSKTIQDQTKLAAYLVLKPEFDPKAFIAHLKGWLKAEEMPILIKLDVLPIMTVSDKIDRQMLKNRVDKPHDYLLTSSPSEIEGDETMKKLIDIWTSTLKIKPTSFDDDFVQFGGNSIAALRLVSLIQSNIDPQFTYQDLLKLDSITLTNIHQRLSSKIISNEKNVAIIKPLALPIKVDKPNVFMLPPLLGEGYFSYLKLAQSYMRDHDVNMYGLTDPGLYDAASLPKTLDEAVDHYVAAIQKIQPQGPYKLMGFSYGCSLAYHVAAKLKAQGHHIDGLHLVDGFSPMFYQKISTEQHAYLLSDFYRFIVQILNNSFYNENIQMKDLSVSGHEEKITQISTLTNDLLKNVKNDLSRNLLRLMQSHLLFMLQDTNPIQLSTWMTRLYLSKSDQNFVSLIDKIPGLSPGDFDHTYYYWNRYFFKLRRCEMTANSDHLSLITNKESTRLFFQYHPVYIKYIPFIFEYSIIPNQPYIIKNSNDYTLMITNISYENIAGFKEGFLALNILSEIASFRQDIKFYNTKNPNDSFYEERYVLMARFPTGNLRQINQYIDRNLDKEYKNNAPLIKLGKKDSITDTIEKINKENASISSLIIVFNFQDSKPMEFRFDPIAVNINLLQSILEANFSRWLSISQKNNELILEFTFDHTASGYLLSTLSVGSCMTTLLPIIMPYLIAAKRPPAVQYSTHDLIRQANKLSRILNDVPPVYIKSSRKCSIM